MGICSRCGREGYRANGNSFLKCIWGIYPLERTTERTGSEYEYPVSPFTEANKRLGRFIDEPGFFWM